MTQSNYDKWFRNVLKIYKNLSYKTLFGKRKSQIKNKLIKKLVLTLICI